MPAHKKYFTEEELLEAKRQSYRKYNKSAKGASRREKHFADNKVSPEKLREYSRRWRMSLSPERLAERRAKQLERERNMPVERTMLQDAKKRARAKGLDFDISIEDIKVPAVCPVLGIPLFKMGGKRTDNSPSIDRVDNSLGYLKGNIMIISSRANLLKNNGTLEEFKSIVKYMEGHNAVVRDQ